MERELGRELTPDEVRALRLSQDAADPPYVIERRRPDDEPETEAAKAGE